MITLGVAMTTIKVNTEIDHDGRLRLNVPLGLPAGKAEVLIVVQQEAPVSEEAPISGRARSGLFVGKPGGDIDVDAALEGMNHAWQSKLCDLK